VSLKVLPAADQVQGVADVFDVVELLLEQIAAADMLRYLE
jgi:hypothetical protein